MLCMFYLLAIICDKLFVPALERIAMKLRMSAEFAGATLMAVGSSAPELFTSIFAVFNTTVWSEVGAGTIVGSAIFNILIIIGATALVKDTTVSWKPIVRDLVFYAITIVLLLFVFYDGQIFLWETVLFIGAYIFYVWIAKNWWKRFDYHVPHVVEDTHTLPFSFFDTILQKIFPKKLPARDIFIFFVSIILIALCTHFMVDSGVTFARWIGVPEVFVGLTILAAGTSIPDLFSSIIAAKKWHGDMATTNALGSNVFDILFGLWFPYALYFIFVWGASISVDQSWLFVSILLLLLSVVLVTIILVFKKRTLTKWVWFVFISLYILYLIYAAFSVL